MKIPNRLKLPHLTVCILKVNPGNNDNPGNPENPGIPDNLGNPDIALVTRETLATSATLNPDRISKIKL